MTDPTSNLLLDVSPFQPSTVLRRPVRGASAVDDMLESANRSARAGALERLADWFPGFDIAASAQRIDCETFAAFTINPARLESLGGARLLDEFLAHHDATHPRLDFARGGEARHLEPPDGVVTPPDAGFRRTRAHVGPLSVSMRDDAYSVIVNSIDQYGDSIDQLCEDLERAYGARVNTNAYLSTGGAPGFGAHWDDHDVIIIQLTGTKQWDIYEPAALAPLLPYVAKETTGRVVWNGVLQPGSAIFIPRGWGHRVEGDESVSLHYTVGINRLNGCGVAAALATLGGRSAFLRGDCPLPLADSAPPEDVTRTLDEFRGAVRDLATPQLIEHVIAHYRASLPMRARDRFSATIAALDAERINDVWIRSSFPGGLMLSDADVDENTDGTVTVAANRRLLRVDRTCLPVLARLAAGEPVRVGDLPSDPAAVRPTEVFVRALVSTGYAHVVPEPSAANEHATRVATSTDPNAPGPSAARSHLRRPSPTEQADYRDRGWTVMRDLVAEPWSAFLADYLRMLDANGRLVEDSQVPGSRVVYGDATFDTLLASITPIVEELWTEPVYPTYSFARLYGPASVLARHTDRPSCEHSISLHLGGDGEPWPLELADEDGDQSVWLEPGDAIAYQGTRLPHWRNSFAGSWHAQVFLHFVSAIGPNSAARFDGRKRLGAPGRVVGVDQARAVEDG